MPGWDAATIDWYAARHGDHASVFAVVDALDIAPDADVLGIGCGTGSALRALAARTSGRLVGADPHERMIARARGATWEAGLAGRIAFRADPAEALGEPDESFDAVPAINAVHHWRDLRRGLTEAARALRPGGSLAVGGERFGARTRPAGQDYGAPMRAAGRVPDPPVVFPGGFVQRAGKPRP